MPPQVLAVVMVLQALRGLPDYESGPGAAVRPALEGRLRSRAGSRVRPVIADLFPAMAGAVTGTCRLAARRSTFTCGGTAGY